MNYHELDVAKQKSQKRVGRGISAGQGKTAGRGTKGQNSRTGGRRRPGFEGGQTPITKRMPKLRGFKSKRPVVETVYTFELNQFASKKVNNFILAEAGLLADPHAKAKVILKGELTSKVDLSLQGATSGAEAAIKKAGGTFTKVPQIPRLKKEEIVIVEETK